MIPIKYITGDATRPIGYGTKLILHIVNDVGAWGAGFVMALSARDSRPEAAYRVWSGGGGDGSSPFSLGGSPFILGQIQVIPFDALDGSDTYVVNMLAQRRLSSMERLVKTAEGHKLVGLPPIRYAALSSCLFKVLRVLEDSPVFKGATVHMPRIGCGLAGGEWKSVEPLIISALSSHDIAVTVYDLPPMPVQW